MELRTSVIAGRVHFPARPRARHAELACDVAIATAPLASAWPPHCDSPPSKVRQSATFFAEEKAARNARQYGANALLSAAAGAAVPRAQESAKTEKCAGGIAPAHASLIRGHRYVQFPAPVERDQSSSACPRGDRLLRLIMLQRCLALSLFAVCAFAQTAR